MRGDGGGDDMVGNIPFIVQPNECWQEDKSLIVLGDFTKVAYSMGMEFNFDISNQATVTIDGQPVNLWEKDMTALRFWFTFGFNTANPINRSNRSLSEAERSPFAILLPEAE